MNQQRALVTGASRGIGKAIALRLAKHGYHVALVARSTQALNEVQQHIQAVGGKASVFSLDLADSVIAAAELPKILDSFGDCEILVNNAGTGLIADVVDTDLERWQTVLDLNLTAAFLCMKAVIPGMRSRGGGIIANIVSVAAKQAFPGWGAYCATKFGLLGLSQAVAQEERQHGIRVTAFCPGAVNTDLWDTLPVDFDRAQMLDVDTVADTLLHTLLLPSTAVLEELVLMPSGGSL